MALSIQRQYTLKNHFGTCCYNIINFMIVTTFFAPWTDYNIKMQNKFEPGACFHVMRCSHLEVMCSNLIFNAVTTDNPVSQKQVVGNGSIIFSAFVVISGYSALILI